VLLAFFKALLDANDDRVSFGRVMSMYALTFVLAWDSFDVWFAVHYNLSRPTVPPVPVLPSPGELLGQATFVGSFYGLSKVVSIFTSKSESPDSPQKQSPPLV
jgi:hypothetical protein